MTWGRARQGLSRIVRSAAAVAVLITGTGVLSGYAKHAAAGSVVRIWYATDDPTEAPLIESLAQAFQSAHRGVTVQLTTYGLDDMNQKLALALNAGTAPDLIYTTPRGPGLPVYVRAGKLLDMRTAAQANGWSTALNPGLQQSYNDALSPTGNAGDHVYGVPYALAAVSMIYNQTLFNRLHLSVPKSLAQLEMVAARAKAAGLVPFGLGNADGWLGDDWYLTLVNALSGPATLKPELRLDPRFSFNAAAFTTAGKTLQQWSAQHYFTPQFGGLDAQDGINAFFQGKTVMQLVSSTENGQIVALAAQTHIPVGVFAFPAVSARQPAVMPQSGYEGWAIPVSNHQPRLAEMFITQMLSEQTARALLAHGLLPARHLTTSDIASTQGFQRAYLQALASSTAGIYLDGAPVPNLNATMEANVQLLLQDVEAPAFLVKSLQLVYSSGGQKATSTRTDGEF